MKNDPVIERIRSVRRMISKEHGHNTEWLIRHYEESQRNTDRKIFKREVKENKVV